MEPTTDDSPTESLPRIAPGESALSQGGGRHRRVDSSVPRRYQPVGRRSRRGARRRRSSFWKELPILIGVALVLTFLIQTFVAKVYVIPSGSMETTLHGCVGCNNDRVLVDKLTYRFSEPKIGDVVVFRGPDGWVNTEFTVVESSNPLRRGLEQLGSLIGLAPPDEKDFVKRVIAVGGQTVSCCDARNRVLVDGQPLNEPYLFYLPSAGPPRQDPFGPVTIPEGHLWVMGDSRNNSADSRVPGHGPIPVENVIGKVRFIVLPFDRFGPVEDVDPRSSSVGMPAEYGAAVPLALGLLGPLSLAPPWHARGRRGGLGPPGVGDFLPTRD